MSLDPCGGHLARILAGKQSGVRRAVRQRVRGCPESGGDEQHPDRPATQAPGVDKEGPGERGERRYQRRTVPHELRRRERDQHEIEEHPEENEEVQATPLKHCPDRSCYEPEGQGEASSVPEG